MAKLSSPQTFIGRTLKALRGTEVTQEKLAKTAESLGFDWTRDTVASIEQGRRAVQLEEFLTLPVILERATGRACALTDLFPGDSLIVLSPKTLASADHIRELLRGSRKLRITRPTSRSGLTVTEVLPKKGRIKVLAQDEVLKALLPKIPAGERDALLHWADQVARGQAERKAGAAVRARVDKRLGTTAANATTNWHVAVTLAAHQIWGVALAEKRDRELNLYEAAAQGRLSPRSRQAHLSAITRELIDQDLWPLLREATRRAIE